jgi:tetratricopeptide (TPR) repeat protein
MQTEEINQLLDRAFELVETGNLPGAKTLFEQVCQQDAGNAEAWMMCGSIDAESGNSGAAIVELKRAISLDATLPEPHYYMAKLQQAQGDLEAAIGSAEKAVALDPEYGDASLLAGALCGMLGLLDQAELYCRKAAELLPGIPDSHLNLGNVLMGRGNPKEAAHHFSIVTELQPDSHSAWALLGRAHAQLGEPERSADAYQMALKLNPQSAEACYGLGFAKFQRGQHEEAAGFFDRALELNPGYLDAAISLGTVYQVLGRYTDAIATFQRALAIKFDSAEAMFGKARALIELSRQSEAIPLLREALEIRPDYIEASLNLAAILMAFDQPKEAMRLCNNVLELHPNSLDALALLARIELQEGQVEAAYQRVSPHVTSGAQHVSLAVAYGDICASKQCVEEAIPVLEALQRGQDAMSVTNRRNLRFCLGRLYDKAKDFDKAFENFRVGNELRGMNWDPQVNQSHVDRIIQVFSAEFMKDAPRATVYSEKPVFILGMPRSGTSLVEQILASHPRVHGAGELTDLLQLAQGMPSFLGSSLNFPNCAMELTPDALDGLAQRYLSHLESLSPQALRVTDKMPGNFSFLGLIELMLPGARVIHCVRDPLDTCLSCYFQDFAMSQPHAYDLTYLGLFYRDYERLMAHWKSVLTLPILDVSYEDLVNDQEDASRRLVEFCGLEWDDRCLQFHETRRSVATSSYDQVRRPIYNSSIKRWEKYRKHITPLIDALR